MLRRWLSLLAVPGLILLYSVPALANSADTLPEGVFLLGFKWAYKVANNRFDKSWGGDTRSITADYNFTLYDSDLGMSAKPNKRLGTTDVSYKNYGMEATLTAAYGLTDNIALMAIVPNQYAHSTYGASIKDSQATLLRDDNGTPYMVSFDDATVAKNGALNASDFKEVLSCRYETATVNGQRMANPLCQYRYKPLRTYSRWGINDVIVGLRYKVMQTDTWRQSITVFGKMATGHQKDTDDLFDLNYGDQQTDIGFWWGIDYTPAKWLVVNLSFGYTEQLPEIKDKRIWTRNYDAEGREKGTISFSPYWQKMKVHRDIGGNWDIYLGSTWNFTPYLSYSNEAYFFWKYEDNFWAAELPPKNPLTGGNWQPDFRSMEYGTNQSVIELNNAISFSTIDWVMKGKFPVPLQLAAGYTVGLAGMNFERNHIVSISLSLIGSIFMLENGEEEVSKTSQNSVMPRTSELLPEIDTADILARQEARRQKKLESAQMVGSAWTNYNKMDW